MTLPSRDRVARLVIATAFALSFVAYGVVQLVAAPALSGSFSDLTLDKLVVNAAVDGDDPYVSVENLAGRYGVVLGDLGASELGDAKRIHPRPPGAFLLLLPLMLVPYEYVVEFSLVFNVLAAVALLYAVAVATNIRADWVLLGAPLLVLSHPAISAFEFGSQSFVVAALVTWGAGLMWRRDSRLGGAVLGLAITMKVWPALLLIPLWGRARRQGVLIALAVGGGLNLLASLVFGFSPADIWQGMTSAGEAWVGFAGNGSLASRLVMLGVSVSMATVLSFFVLLPVLHQLWNRTVDFQLVLWGTVLCAVLLSPLSWDHYNLALLPLAIILALRAGNWFDLRRWALLGWAGLTLGGRFVRLVIDRPIEIAGALAFTERALLLVALMLVVFGVRRANRLGSVDPAETLDSVDDTAFVIPDSLRSNERPVA